MYIEKSEVDYSWEIFDIEDVMGKRTKMYETSDHTTIYKLFIAGRILSNMAGILLILITLGYGAVRLFDMFLVMTPEQRDEQNFVLFLILMLVSLIVCFSSLVFKWLFCEKAFASRRHMFIMGLLHLPYVFYAILFAIFIFLINDRMWAIIAGALAILFVVLTVSAVLKFFTICSMEAQIKKDKKSNKQVGEIETTN